MKNFSKRKPTEKDLAELISNRIAIMDGAMGTMIQQEKLEEADFRGDHFKNHPNELKGNNEENENAPPEEEELVSKIKNLKAPDYVKDKLWEEHDRLEMLPPLSSESGVIRNKLNSWLYQYA